MRQCVRLGPCGILRISGSHEAQGLLVGTPSWLRLIRSCLGFGSRAFEQQKQHAATKSAQSALGPRPTGRDSEKPPRSPVWLGEASPVSRRAASCSCYMSSSGGKGAIPSQTKVGMPQSSKALVSLSRSLFLGPSVSPALSRTLSLSQSLPLCLALSRLPACCGPTKIERTQHISMSKMLGIAAGTSRVEHAAATSKKKLPLFTSFL